MAIYIALTFGVAFMVAIDAKYFGGGEVLFKQVVDSVHVVGLVGFAL